MADNLDTTNPPEIPAESPLEKAVSEWEAPIGELRNASFVTSEYIEDLLKEANAEDYYHITKERAEGALFLVYDLDRRVREFRDEYYTVLEGPGTRDDQRERRADDVDWPALWRRFLQADDEDREAFDNGKAWKNRAAAARSKKTKRIVDEAEKAILETPANNVQGLAVKLLVAKRYDGERDDATDLDINITATRAALKDALRLAGLEEFGVGNP